MDITNRVGMFVLVLLTIAAILAASQTVLDDAQESHENSAEDQTDKLGDCVFGPDADTSEADDCVRESSYESEVALKSG